MQNPVVYASNGAICCKLWPQTILGLGGPKRPVCEPLALGAPPLPQRKRFWFLGQGFWFLGQSFWFLGQGFWFLGQGFLFLGQGFWFLRQGFWFLGQGF